MIESDNSFDDFEFGEDVEDPWDDEEEQEGSLLSTKSPKKYKHVKLFVVVLFLSGSAYTTLLFLPELNTKPHIPIVQIDEPQELDTQILTPAMDENDHSIEIKIEASTEVLTKENKDTPTPSTQTARTEKPNLSLLTPMPDNTNNDTISLSKLLETAPASSTDDTQTQNPASPPKALALSEQELLSKTETVYEERITKTERSSVAEIVSAPPLDGAPPQPEDISKTTTNNVPPKTPDIQQIASIETFIEPIIPSIKPTIKKTTNTENSTKTQKPVTSKKPIWLIKAAQSGKAVIYDKNSQKIQSIEINDKIDGIGRIKSIEMRDGRWVIIDTLGRIKQ